MARPLLPFLGTKRHHLDLISDSLPPPWKSPHKQGYKYIEPFLGSGIVFQHINPEIALISDASPYVMCMFQSLKLDRKRFLDRLEILYQNNSQMLYNACKTRIMEGVDPFDKGSLFAYLQRCSLYSFTCPRMDLKSFRGTYKTSLESKVLFVERKNWNDFADMLCAPQVQMVESDFESIIDQANHGDFLFLDPPYVGTGTRVYLKFTKADHERLMRKINEVSARGVYVMMFNHSGLDLSNNPELFKTPVFINRPSNSFRNYEESIYTNYELHMSQASRVPNR